MISLKRKRIDPEDVHPPNAPDSQTLKGFFSSASEETQQEILWQELMKWFIGRQFLQNHGFNVKHQTVNEGRTVTETLVSEIVRNNQKDVLLYVLDHGADVNYM